MFSHVMVGTNDIAKSKRFYDALLKVLGAGEDAHGTWWGRSPSRVMNQYRAVMVHYSRVKQTPPGDVSPSLRVENDEHDAHVLLAMPSRSEASVGTLSHGSNEPLPRGTDPLLAQETDPPGTRVTITKPGHQVTRGRKVRGLSEACSTSRTRPTSLIKVLCPSLRIEHDELDATAFSRPSAVALSAMGLVSPFPCAPSRSAATPLPHEIRLHRLRPRLRERQVRPRGPTVIGVQRDVHSL